MSAPAVLAGGWFGTTGAFRAQLPPAPDMTTAELVDVAKYAQVDTVYVLDAAEPLAGDPVGHQVDDARPWRVRVDGVTFVDLGAPGADAAGPFDGLTAGELLAVFGQVERLLGVPWADSIGRTAERLILSTHPRARGGTRLDESPVCPPPAAEATLEMPFMAWRRELTDAERGAAFVHAFDANAQYLAAWGSVELGHGRPVHLTDHPTFDQTVAGVWRVPAPPASVPGGELLPLPWLGGREWFTTPTVRRMLEVADGLDLAYPFVAEAWVWPEHSRFLRGAAEKLRDARRLAGEAMTGARARLAVSVDPDAAARDLRAVVVAGVVRDIVKDTYARQTGRFAMGARDERSGWARPDWSHMIRAQARVNLHRRLASLGAAPFAIATDGLLFLSDEPDAAAFAERIRLPLGEQLGAFAHDATAPGYVARDALDAKPRGVLHIFQAIGAHSATSG